MSRRLLSRCKKFESSVSSCRKYLANFCSSALLDSMADQARRADDLGRRTKATSPTIDFAFSDCPQQ